MIGGVTWDIKDIVKDPSLSGDVLRFPRFKSDRDGLQLECVEGRLRLRQIFDDGSGIFVMGGPSEVRFNEGGRVTRIVFRQALLSGLGDDLRDRANLFVLTFLDNANRNQVVKISVIATDIALFRISYVEPPYRGLFVRLD